LTSTGADVFLKNLSPLDPVYVFLYSSASSGGLGYFPPLTSNTTPQAPLPYNQLTTEQQDNIKLVAQQIFDGQCAGWEASAGHCTNEQSIAQIPLIDDGAGSVNLGAITLLANQQILKNNVVDVDTWNGLSVEDQWALTALTYKEGIGTANLAIQAAKNANNGIIQNWDQIAQGVMIVDADCQPNAQSPSDCGVHYVDQIICYASSISNQSENPCGSQ
jgi:hypothetical protein